MNILKALIFSAALLPPFVFAQGAKPAAATSTLATALIELREVELTYPAEALVEAVRQSTIAAQVQGRVTELRVDAGERVRQGDLLLRLDEREAAQGVAGSRAQYDNAKANYERTLNLFRQKFISQAALDKAEADYKAASASSGQAGTVLSFTRITSPLTGIVAQRHTELGEMAVPGKPLITVFDPRSLRVVANIPQYKLAAVRKTQRALIEFPESGQWIEAAKVEVLPVADARTHVIRARVYLPENIESSASPMPGMFARVHFVIGKTKKLIAPLTAVVRRGEVSAVYVIDAQGVTRLRQVRFGDVLAGGNIEVLAGLSAGERVALDPIQAGISLKQNAAASQ